MYTSFFFFSFFFSSFFSFFSSSFLFVFCSSSSISSFLLLLLLLRIFSYLLCLFFSFVFFSSSPTSSSSSSFLLLFLHLLLLLYLLFLNCTSIFLFERATKLNFCKLLYNILLVLFSLLLCHLTFFSSFSVNVPSHPPLIVFFLRLLHLPSSASPSFVCFIFLLLFHLLLLFRLLFLNPFINCIDGTTKGIMITATSSFKHIIHTCSISSIEVINKT